MTDNLVEVYGLFTAGVDQLFGHRISHRAETIYYSDFRTDKISIYEMMFLLSDPNPDLDKIALLKARRSLSKLQWRKVIGLAKAYADPRRFDGDKTTKRDFANWKNEAQQVLGLLKTTIYFEADSDGFKLNS